MKLLIILIPTLLILSCSEERRITKFVKKHGAKEIATYIAINHPEYLRSDTIRRIDSFSYPVTVKVIEIKHDTIFKKDTINNCEKFVYSDRRLDFNLSTNLDGRQSVKYKIKERFIQDTVSIIRNIAIPGPPCPQAIIIQEAKKKFDIEVAILKEKLNSAYKLIYSLSFILIIILCYIGFKIYRKITNV